MVLFILIFPVPETPRSLKLVRNKGHETNQLTLTWVNPSNPANDENVIYKAKIGNGVPLEVTNGKHTFTQLNVATSYTTLIWAEVPDKVKSIEKNISIYTGKYTN